MKNESLAAVRKAIEELRIVEQSLMLESKGGEQKNIPTNEVLQKHRTDNKSWRVTPEKPAVVASFAFEDPNEVPTYPHITTFTQDSKTLLELFDEIREYIADQTNDGKVITYVDMRLASKGLTLDVVDKEVERPEENNASEDTDDQ